MPSLCGGGDITMELQLHTVSAGTKEKRVATTQNQTSALSYARSSSRQPHTVRPGHLAMDVTFPHAAATGIVQSLKDCYWRMRVFRSGTVSYPLSLSSIFVITTGYGDITIEKYAILNVQLCRFVTNIQGGICCR